MLHSLSRRVDYHNTYDPVTNLLNARAFEDQMARVISCSPAGTAQHAFLLFDLDRFSVINESCGMVAGNELLQQVAVLIHNVTRKGDLVARLGGDKFAVLLENCPPEKAVEIAENLRHSIEEHQFRWYARAFHITSSGAVVIIDNGGESSAELIQKANQYCNAAKDLGRNRICLTTEEQVSNNVAQRRSRLTGLELINRAFDEDRFYLSYQPIVPISGANGRFYFEVLIRMTGEDGAELAPARFIPAAEQYGMISRLDRWVFDTALEFLENHPAIQQRLGYCSINLSGHSIGNPDLLDHIVSRLKGSSLPPERLCFEVTETAAVSNLADAMRFIGALKGLGCRFALDDFGSGLSSFAYLRNLDADIIKIDGQFVSNLLQNGINYESVLAIHRIARVTGKDTIAEFVENAEIHGLLKDIGVSFGQGYFYDKPRRLEDLPRLH